MPKFPYPHEVNGKLVTGNGSLIPICSLSNSSLMPSLTVTSKQSGRLFQIFVALSEYFRPLLNKTQNDVI